MQTLQNVFVFVIPVLPSSSSENYDCFFYFITELGIGFASVLQILGKEVRTRKEILGKNR